MDPHPTIMMAHRLCGTVLIIIMALRLIMALNEYPSYATCMYTYVI